MSCDSRENERLRSTFDRNMDDLDSIKSNRKVSSAQENGFSTVILFYLLGKVWMNIRFLIDER